MSKTGAKQPSFGDLIRRRRRKLDLTQAGVATRIKTSASYVGNLESGQRHPSDKIVRRLAEVLGLDTRVLLFLANPHTEALLADDLRENAEGSDSAWEQLRKNVQLRNAYNVSNMEMEMLSRVELLGEVQSTRDLIYILNAVRHAMGK
jgi:transcriptional regulator with XRE-family HTH domain